MKLEGESGVECYSEIGARLGGGGIRYSVPLRMIGLYWDCQNWCLDTSKTIR